MLVKCGRCGFLKWDRADCNTCNLLDERKGRQ